MKFKEVRKIVFAIFVFCLFTLPLFSADTGDDIHDLLFQRDFEDGVLIPWEISESDDKNADIEILDGELAVHVNEGGENKWDVQIRHRKLKIEKGHSYSIRFKVRASADTEIYVKIGSQGAPYNEYWNNNWSNIALPAGEVVEISDTFTMDKDTDEVCELAVHMGGPLLGSKPVDIFFDDIHLEDPEYERPIIVDRKKKEVRINQVGYFPGAKKIATIVSASTTPITWELKNSDGVTVLSGKTTVFGDDTASEDHVHNADFSDYTVEGTGYTLSIEGTDPQTEVSHPFDISPDIYSKMKYDAFAYFYHNRSGIPILMPYAGSEEHTRGAGHLSDIMFTWPDTGQENYSLDVSKGWYDAGDHGKYVVNGGISIWTMMNQYERTLYVEGADKSAFADGAVNIPENNNGYPDILDEARWEMEMLLGFQVPDDKPYAGMAHHKGHDEKWTGIPLKPEDDPQTRYLRPVSTAATLNLAAAAAQSARLWADLDPEFSEQCLIAAEKAWLGAASNPDILAGDFGTGGGSYNDGKVDDEFYWAACELFVTTGKTVYKTYMENSRYYLQVPSMLGEDPSPGVFNWQSTQGLGSLSLALVPNGLSQTDLAAVRANVLQSADSFLALIAGEGYRVPLDKNSYPWGSNSVIINNLIVMGFAYDYSGNEKYINGMNDSMDYILGRNAMDQSYVSGYGEVPLLNPHHRFWAKQMDPDFPLAPAGCLSGGPNTGLEDPYVKGIGLPGAAPQKCFVDNINSWSTNEITINWNAPFSWVTAFLDEERGEAPLSVTLTAPANGAQFKKGDIQLEASTTGEAVIVNFYANDTLVGQDTSAPFSCLWENVTPGLYVLKAQTVGPDGSFIDSEIVTIEVVENILPEVTLLTPENGQVYGVDEAVVLEASASDADGEIACVDFKVDGQVVFRDTMAPFSYDMGLMSLGPHSVTAEACDNENALSLPVSVTFVVKQVDPFPPEVTLTSPGNGTVFEKNRLVSITADAGDADGTVEKVEFFVDMVKIGEDLTSPYQCAWTAGAAGPYSICAVATDNTELSTTSDPVSITVKEPADSDLVVQSVSSNSADSTNQLSGKFNIVNKGTGDVDLKDLTLRYYYTRESQAAQGFNCYWAIIGADNVKGIFKTEAGQFFLELSFTGGTAPAGGNTGEIQYAINNSDWSNYSQSNDYSFSDSAFLTDNSKITLYQNGILVWGKAPGGNTGDDPTVSLVSPENGAAYLQGESIKIQAKAADSDGTVSKVDFYNGTVKLGSDTSAPYEYTINDAAAGTYSLKAVAADNEGRTGSSAVRTVTVSPVQTELTLMVTIKADPGRTESVTLSPAPDTGSAAISGANGYSQSVTYLTPGTITLSTTGEIKSWGGAVSGNAASISFDATAGNSYLVTADFTGGTSGETILVEAEKFTGMNGVQTEACGEGGENVGWIDRGDWMDYTINAKGGTYQVEFRVAGWDNAAALDMLVDGTSAVKTAITNTGGYQEWTTVKSNLSLTPGNHTVRLLSTGPGWNINYFKLIKGGVLEDCTLSLSPAALTTGSGTYKKDEVVQISYTGQETFIRWSGDTASVADVNSADTTVRMTGSIFLTAITQTIGGDTPVDYYGEMKVNGSYINGSRTNAPMQVKGMSLFWNQWGGERFWNAETVNRMADEFNCEIIRAAASTDNGVNEAQVSTVVEAAIAKGIYVIIDFHSHHAHNQVEQAQTFFRNMVEKYGAYDNVIFEIYNEPTYKDDGVTWETVKTYADVLVKTIRDAGSDNLILVGAPCWCQDFTGIAENPVVDPADNTAYVMHFYAYSHKVDDDWLGKNFKAALAQGLPFFISEWGTTHYNGGREGYEDSHDAASSDAWLALLDEYKISWCNWSVFDDPQGSAMWHGGSLSDSGKYVTRKLAEWAESAPWR